MAMLKKLLTGILLTFAAPAYADDVHIDVQATYGMTLAGIASAISFAATHFTTNPDDVVFLDLPEGEFDFSSQTSGDAITINNIVPGPSGRLKFVGKGVDKTKLIFHTDVDQFHSANSSRLSFENIRFDVNTITVTQGIVVSKSNGLITLDIQTGFPTPGSLWPGLGQGQYIRRCTNSVSYPQMIEVDNDQIAWKDPVLINGQRWQLTLFGAGSNPTFYSVGDLVAVKSKSLGQAGFFTNADDIIFDHIIWARHSRVVFRGGSKNIQVKNVLIPRDIVNGQTACLSTSEGGPQIGQPADPATSGNVVQNFSSDGTGDDSIAFFNSTGTVDTIRVRDSFVRGVLFCNSPTITVQCGIVERCPILYLPSC